MEEPTSHRQLAVQTDTIDGTFMQYLCHLKASNWTYTILRSIVLVSPEGLDEIFNYLHYCIGHTGDSPTDQHKPGLQDSTVLLYWSEKPSICENCTSFLVQLLASSWYSCGWAFSGTHNFINIDLTQLEISNCELIAVMSNLFKYMSAAYDRLEKETKAALQSTEAYSKDLTDACKEYFGENFDVSSDAGRLEALLTTLHENNVSFLYARLLGGHHIDDTLARDREILTKATTPTAEQVIELVEEVQSQTEQHAALIPIIGKNHEKNRKKLERKKKKRANAAESTQGDALDGPRDSLNETIGNPAVSAELHDGPDTVDENAAHNSQLTIINGSKVAQSAVPAEMVNESVVGNEVTVCHTIIEESTEKDCPIQVDLPATIGSPAKLPVVPEFVEEENANVASVITQAENVSDQYEATLDYRFEADDDQNWTQVVANRKNSKKSKAGGVNPYKGNMSSVSGKSRFSRQGNKPQAGVNLRTTWEVAPTPNRRAQTQGSLQNQQTFPEAVSKSTNSKLNESAHSLSTPAVVKPGSPRKKASVSVATPTASKNTNNISVSTVSLIPGSKDINIHPEPAQKLDQLQNSAQPPVLSEQVPKALQPISQVSTSTELVVVQPKAGPNYDTLQPSAQVSAAFEQAVCHAESGLEHDSLTIEDHPLPIPSSGITQKQGLSYSAISTKTETETPPSIPEVPTVSITSPTVDNFCSPKSSENFTDLPAVTAVENNTPTPESHFDTQKVDLVDPAIIGTSIADSQRNIKNSARFSPDESIDPGLVPYYQHLQPRNRKDRRKMSETTDSGRSNNNTPLSDTISLVESLRDAGVEDDAMPSLVSRAAAALVSSSSRLALPDTGGSRRRDFIGKHLDVRRANNSPRSADNSPIPPQPDREPVYHYPPPDVLTPRNQEILDLIAKGPPYKKYPRVSVAVDPWKDQPLAADFVTKKPLVVTYDGKDAYQVLGDRCPTPLTIKDHPDVNKCIQQGEVFHCGYCRVEIPGTAELEKGIICPGCGPCSDTRYCQRSHLLADSINHSKDCGENTGTYPLMWSGLPLDYQSLYPYIKPLTGPVSPHFFRQMAHCLVINSNGIIENPFKAYFETKMPMEDKVKAYGWIQEMCQFQDKGSYYLFHPNTVAGGVDIELIVILSNGSDGSFREDQRFARVRNAAFLTQHPTLLCVLYRRIKEAIHYASPEDVRFGKRMAFLNRQFHEEFPSLDPATIAPLDKGYCFENDWKHVRRLVHDLELKTPILRAWITEDAEDDGIPVDPTARFQGKYWDIVLDGPTFRGGSTDRQDWGPGWFGGNGMKWQRQLDRKYLKMINDELVKVETEIEGEII